MRDKCSLLSFSLLFGELAPSDYVFPVVWLQRRICQDSLLPCWGQIVNLVPLVGLSIDLNSAVAHASVPLTLYQLLHLLLLVAHLCLWGASIGATVI